MIMPIYFIQPWWLLLLLLPLPLFHPRFRRRGRLLTGAAFACLVLAAAGPVLERPATQPRIASIVQTAEEALRIKMEHPERQILQVQDARWSEALLQADADKIYLHGNGRDSDGNLKRTAALLNSRGISVEAVPAPPSKQAQVLLLDAQLPPVSGLGETLELKLRIYAPQTMSHSIAINGKRHSLELEEGVRDYRLPYTAGKQGMNIVDVDGARQAATYARPPYRVQLISRQPERDAKILQSILSDSAEVRTDGSPDCELAVINGAALGDLDEATQNHLTEKLKQGMGLLIFTDRTPVGDSVLGRALPMRFESQDLKKNPISSLVIIIDTSGSMSGPRIDLAREVARLALDRLRTCDYAGIVEFHGNRRWAAPLQSAGNYLELRRSLNRLNAGGGTVILPAIREAYFGLRNMDTRLKHVLVITDGGVEYGDFEKLIREMAEQKITLSTVMVGPGSGNFLAQLATWGGGRFYQASSRFALPDLQFRQSGRNSLPPYINGDFPLTVHGIPGMPETIVPLPAIQGLLPGELKKTAAQPVKAGEYPLLSWWQYGMGKCAVFASELNGEWSRDLYADDSFRAMLAGICRQLPDAGRFGSGLECRNQSVNRDLELYFDGAPETFIVTIYHNDEILDRLTVSGGYLYRPNMPEGVYRIEAGKENFAVALANSPTDLPVDEELLAQINRNTAEISINGQQFYGFRAIFGVLGILFFAVQIGYRRLGRFAVLLVAVLALQAEGGEYRPLMRNAIDLSLQSRHAEAAQLYGQAAEAAGNARDQRYARLWQFESARSAGTLAPLLDQWRRSPGDDIRLELTVNELEEQGRFEEAFALLSANSARLEFQEQLIRLAEKCGRPQAVLSIYESRPDDVNMIHGRARFELLAGNRKQAETVYRQAIERSRSPEILLNLAAGAEKSFMRDLAEIASRKASEINGRPDYFLPAMRFREGKPEEAAALLASIARSDKELLAVADYYEQFGMSAPAIETYRRVGSEEARIRIAMLLEQNGRKDEALAEWHGLMESTDNELRAQQSMQQIMGLKDPKESLAEELKKTLTPRRIKFIAMLYSRLRNLDGLKEFLEKHAQSPELQKLRLDFLLDNKLYADAAPLLESLMKEDPGNAREYLQQLTILAIETGNRELADKCLSQFDSAMMSLEFMASVAELLNDYPRAAEIYRQCLEQFPDRIELWLSWGNTMRKCGRTGEAIEFFTSRLSVPSDADEFGVMVDGLLNLEAPPQVLNLALDAVLKRLHNELDNSFYYRLADDLAEELKRPDVQHKYLLYLMVTAPERRTQLLRQLMADAMKSSTGGNVTSLGRILIGTGEILPEDIYLDMGKIMLRARNPVAAERFFKLSSTSAADYTSVQRSMAAAWRDAGLLDEADRMMRELLILDGDNIELRVDYGELLELQRKPEAAAEHYHYALTLLISRQSTENDITRRRARNVSEFRRWYPALTRALVNCCAAAETGIPADLKRRAAEDSSPIRKKYWTELLRQIAEVRGDVSPAPPATARRPARPPRVSVTDFAGKLKRTNAAERPALLLRELEQRKSTAPQFAWGVLQTLDFKPDEQLAAVFLETLRAAPKSPAAGFNRPPNRNIQELNLKIAEMVLEKSASNPDALALAAVMRSRSGDQPGAVRLALDLFVQVSENKNYDRQGINLCHAIAKMLWTENGPEAEKKLRQLLDELEDTRTIGGNNVNLSALIAGLYEIFGDYRNAAQNYVRAWQVTSDDCFGVVRSAFNCYEKLGAIADLYDVLKENAPKQNVVRTFYYMQLVRLQRELYHLPEALEASLQLNKFLQERELLRIDLAAGDYTRLRRDLLRLTLYQRNTEGIRNLIVVNMDSPDGMNEIPFRKSIYQMVAEQTPEVRDDFVYLLLGMPVSNPVSTVLFSALKACPPPRISSPCSPQQLLLAALRPEGLAETEEQRLNELIASGLFPEKTVLELLDCPGIRHPEALAGLLLRKQLDENRISFETAARCLSFLPQEKQRQTALDILAATTAEADLEQRLLFIRQYFPEKLPQEFEKLKTGSCPEGSWLELAAGRIGLDDYLLYSMPLPPWQDILQVLPPAEQELFWNTIAAKLQDAHRKNVLSADDLIRNLARLSTLTEQHREALSAAARLHHREPGEATLWLIDALPQGSPEKDALIRQMIDRRSVQAWRVLDYLKRQPHPAAAVTAAAVAEWLPHPEIIATAMPAIPADRQAYFRNLLEFYNQASSKENQQPINKEKEKKNEQNTP
jgi:thioredoxin-like negative regulator of GroEL